ncbi:MAG: acyltransferase [Alistipes sp.]|nr:acyltransferase [Alistipes sp.]
MSKEPEKQWNGKSRGGRFGYLFFIYSIRFLGIRFAYAILAFIVVYFIAFAPKATAAIWRYNRRIRRLGRCRSAAELYRHYYVFGQTLIDRLAFRGGLADRYRFEFDNYGRFLEIIDSAGGVVMIGAHTGCWEAGAGFFGKYGKKINIVMFDDEHSGIKEAVDDNASTAGDYKIIAVNRDPLEAMLSMKIALNNGEYLCFNGDRWIDEKSTAGRIFMGYAARFPSGPFLLAAKCRVPVVFYYAMRESGRRYRFIFREAEACGDSVRLMEEYTASLEDIAKRYPCQWFNFYDFWDYNKQTI